MILAISSLAQTQQCADALQQALNEPVNICSTIDHAIEELQQRAFSAVIFDQWLLEADPQDGETVLKNLSDAVPVYANFAISGSSRIAREVRSAMRRRKQELTAARNEAAQTLRHELNETVTALLLSCEIALQVPELPQDATSKMQAVEALALEIKSKLGETAG